MKHPANPLWRTDTHRNVWLERWCDRCVQADQVAHRRDPQHARCPILNRALTSGRKPPEWDRNPGAQTMDSTIRCTAFLDQPPVLRRATVEDQTLAMFDVEPIAAPDADHA